MTMPQLKNTAATVIVWKSKNRRPKVEEDNTAVSKNTDENDTKGRTIISPLPLKYIKVSIPHRT